MKPNPSRLGTSCGFVSAILFLGILLGSGCNGDLPDKPGTTTNSGSPPALPSAAIRIVPTFQSQDANAREAQYLVFGRLNMARRQLQTPEACLANLRTMTWTPSGRTCWQAVQRVNSSCSYTFRVCGTGTGYRWSEILDGHCNALDPGSFYSAWTRCEGTTNLTATSGEFFIYMDNTREISTSLSWIAPPSARAEWVFFDGAMLTRNLVATFTSQTHTDSAADYTWDEPGQAKWELHVAENGAKGSMVLYTWFQETQGWLEHDEIAWLAGHGQWSTFDETGRATGARSW
jgi:hypothetical protein